MEVKPEVKPEIKPEIKPGIKPSMYTRMRQGGVIQSVPNKDVEEFKKKGFTVV